MNTANTRKILRKAFADFEAAYVGVEAICRDADVITPRRAAAMLAAMRSVHFGIRQMLAEVERTKAMEEETRSRRINAEEAAAKHLLPCDLGDETGAITFSKPTGEWGTVTHVARISDLDDEKGEG